MNNIVKLSLFAAIAVGIFVAVPSNTFAWAGGSGGEGGCCGGGGYDGGYSPSPDPSPEPPVVVPAKCVSLTASRTTVPYEGANVILTWQTQNASSVTLSGYGSVSANGSKTVFVNSNTTFNLTVTDSRNNSDTCTVTIKVEAPKPVAKCDFLTSNRSSVPHGGANVVLSWGTTNATSVSINNGVGSVLVDGSKTVFVNSNTTFTLTAVGTGGNDTCTVTVTVKPPVSVPATCDFLNSSKSTLPYGGGNVVLTWGTTNATSVSINNGVGTVSVDGSKTVFVNSNTTFTLTAVGTDNNDTCTVTVTVQPPVNDLTPRCDFLNVSDTRVEEGDRVTLSWGTTNANRVTISPNIGDVADDGSTTVTVNNDTTYTLRARNIDNGQEDTCTVTVRVDEKKETSKTPRCDLEISKNKVNRGDRVTLSWETSYADSVRIRDDQGKTIFDTSDYSSSQRRRYLDGEIDVIINRDTTFTLTARGDGGSKTCRVTVKTDDIAVYEKRDQGYVIALTSVPYTGFEAGTFLTFLFYAILTLWALFVAYVLVIKKSSILGFSLYGQASMNETDLENRKKVEALVAKYAGPNSK